MIRGRRGLFPSWQLFLRSGLGSEVIPWRRARFRRPEGFSTRRRVYEGETSELQLFRKKLPAQQSPFGTVICRMKSTFRATEIANLIEGVNGVAERGGIANLQCGAGCFAKKKTVRRAAADGRNRGPPAARTPTSITDD